MSKRIKRKSGFYACVFFKSPNLVKDDKKTNMFAIYNVFTAFKIFV